MSLNLQQLEEAVRKAFSELSAGEKVQLLRDLGVELVSQTEERLELLKKAPDGTPWPGWSKSYEQWRQKIGKANQNYGILSGDLFKSITYNVIDDGSVEWGATKEYASFFQDGYLARKSKKNGEVSIKRQPARPFVGLSKMNEAELLEITEKYLERLLHVKTQ